MIIKKISALVLTAVLVLGAVCGCENKKNHIINENVNTDNRNEITIQSDYSECEQILSEMSTKEKIAQKMLPAFRFFENDLGELSAVTELNSEIADSVRNTGFSGVILFAENISTPEQTTKLINDFQTANAKENRPQLFVGVDQEGGSITRLSYGTSFCGNMALAAEGSLSDTETCGRIIGSELSALGFNVDFAPVADINSNPMNPVIGTRSFSDDPNITAKFADAFVHGLQSEGIFSCLKHFPGHGDTNIDSHTGLPCINKSYDELKNNELIPFADCLDSDMIMTAHIQFPNIEYETYTSISTGEEITLPATLSKKIITDILRNDLGYNGVVLTDAMQMDAIAQNFDLRDSAFLAFNADVDILLVPMDIYNQSDIDELDNLISDIAALADNGTLPMDTIDRSVMRILKLKQQRGLLNQYQDVLDYGKLSQIGCDEQRKTEWDISKKSITLVKNDNNNLPIKSGKTIVLTAYEDEVENIEYELDDLRRSGRIPRSYDITVMSREADEDRIKTEISSADNVIAFSEINYAEEMSYMDSLMIDSLIEYAHNCGAKFTLLSCELPYDAARYQSADSIMIAWSSKGASEDSRITDGDVNNYSANIPCALCLAFSQTESPTGKLPVNIPVLDDNYEYTEEILYSRDYGISYN